MTNGFEHYLEIFMKYDLKPIFKKLCLEKWFYRLFDNILYLKFIELFSVRCITWTVHQMFSRIFTYFHIFLQRQDQLVTLWR